jgi:hypothetical protein
MGPTFSALESKVGRVLLVGESEQAGHFERELRGLDKPSASVGEYVVCSRAPSNGGTIVELEAGTTTPLARASVQLPQPGAQELEQPFSGVENPAVRVRSGDKAFDFYEYALLLGDPANGCHLQLRAFDDARVAGTLTCRGLSPTAQSRDAVAPGGTATTASATFDFDCPFHVLSAPATGGSSSGGSGFGGGGGSTAGGGAAGSAGSGGSGGTVPTRQCTGVNTPCSLRTSLTCEEGTGCTRDDHCSGVPLSCYGQFNVYSCTAIEGCFWASSSKTCSGAATPCSSHFGSATCEGQQGCNWEAACKGTAPLCSELSEELCELEPACHLL